jgi:hypothetical protein
MDRTFLVGPSLILAACIALITTGCHARTGNTYRVIIDPNFSAENQELARSAVATWRSALGDELNIWSVEVGECHASGSPGRELCIHASTGAWLTSQFSYNVPGVHDYALTWRDVDNDSADTYVAVDLISGQSLQRSVTHELGHAMGLQHTQPGTLMFWFMNADEALVPTCVDKLQWHQLRGMNTTDDSSCPATTQVTYFH